MKYTFFVHGEPRPKGSMKLGRRSKNGRPNMIQQSKYSKPWQENISHIAKLIVKNNNIKIYKREVPVRVDLDFYFKEPKKGKYKYHTKAPDKDKLERNVLDALTGIFYEDDCQVICGTTTKNFHEKLEGVMITISQCYIQKIPNMDSCNKWRF